MVETFNTHDQVETLLTNGLMNMWYPVLPSWSVHSEPVGITRLSRNIALWRENNGKVNAVEDRCPHRGARVAWGWCAILSG